jgi:hypothetical protein
MLLVLLVAFLFIWSATQWTAWSLGFQAQLGPPIGEVFGVPVYHLLIFFYWWYAYDAYALPDKQQQPLCFPPRRVRGPRTSVHADGGPTRRAAIHAVLQHIGFDALRRHPQTKSP